MVFVVGVFVYVCISEITVIGVGSGQKVFAPESYFIMWRIIISLHT